MNIKRSYKNDIIRAAGLILAVLIFFGGPYLIQDEAHKDRKDLMQKVGRSRAIPNQLRLDILEQLNDDAEYIRQHSNTVTIFSVSTSASNWLSVLVLLVTFGLPVLTKYIENKKTIP